GDEGYLKRRHAETVVRGKRVGKLLPISPGGDLNLRPCLLERYARLQPSRHLEVMTLVRAVGIQLKGKPYFGCRAELLDVETGTDDTAHDVRIAAWRNRLADNLH